MPTFICTSVIHIFYSLIKYPLYNILDLNLTFPVRKLDFSYLMESFLKDIAQNH